METDKKYYIQLFSPHGLIRYQNPEIGRDKDTGGQVKYVLELLEALSNHPKVRKIDLFTRRIKDRRVSPSYGKEIEKVGEKARIVRPHKMWRKCLPQKRITCGIIWTNLLIKQSASTKRRAIYPIWFMGIMQMAIILPLQLSQFFFKPPFSVTGHSLGRNTNRRILLEQGLSPKKINEQYNIEKRINAEEAATCKSQILVVTSTSHEIEYPICKVTMLFDDRQILKSYRPGSTKICFTLFTGKTMPSFEMGIEEEQALVPDHR